MSDGSLRTVTRVCGEIAERARLTDRQTQILHRLSDGTSNRQIATALGITEKTLDCHLHLVFKKIGVARSRELYAMLLKLMEEST